jgi:uncharacterized OB-fold protein
MRSERWLNVLLGMACIALAVIAIRQGVAIASYGVVGWLQGEGPSQSEWEVRASILAIVLLVAFIAGVMWRVGEGIADHLYVGRMVRAVRRERREAAERDRDAAPGP